MSGTTYTTPLAGVAAGTINGTAWSIQGEATWSPSGYVNETLKGQSAVEGFSRMPQQGYIQFTLRDSPTQSVSSLQGASGLTIVLVCANGKVITAVNAWHVETIALNTQEGTFEVRFDAVTVTEEVLSAMADEVTSEAREDGFLRLDTPVVVKGHEPFTEMRLREPVVYDVLMTTKAIGKRISDEAIIDGKSALVARLSGWPEVAIKAAPSSLIEDAFNFGRQYETDARRAEDTEPDAAPQRIIRVKPGIEAVNRTWTEIRLREPIFSEKRKYKADCAKQTQEALFQAEINLVKDVSEWELAAVLKLPISVFASASDYLTGFFIAGPNPGSRFRAS